MIERVSTCFLLSRGEKKRPVGRGPSEHDSLRGFLRYRRRSPIPRPWRISLRTPAMQFVVLSNEGLLGHHLHVMGITPIFPMSGLSYKRSHREERIITRGKSSSRLVTERLQSMLRQGWPQCGHGGWCYQCREQTRDQPQGEKPHPECLGDCRE